MAASGESLTPPFRRLRAPPEADTIIFVIGDSMVRADLPGLCERLRVLLEGSEADQVVCDVGAVVAPDAGTVDALARLQLTARRLGRQVRLRHACGELQELLTLMGLSDVLPLAPGLPLEPRG